MAFTISFAGSALHADALKRFRKFSSRDLPKEARVSSPFSVPYLLLETEAGYLQVHFESPVGSSKNFSRKGTGEPLNVSVFLRWLKDPQETRNFVKKHFRHAPDLSSPRLVAPIKSSRNRERAVSLAKEILSQTYCAKGEVTEDHNFKRVSTSSGASPTVKTIPFAAPAGAWGIYAGGWSVRLKCSSWRKLQ
ncbi:hypothetical protein ETW24_17420 [Leisingera sp. NJS204]|nr:hypothetical protein ETW24_17420 [Leisingera sp. NJS204]